MAEISLLPIPVEELSESRQQFACLPKKAILTVAGCLALREKALLNKRDLTQEKCRGCPVGESLAARFPDVRQAKVLCVIRGCGREAGLMGLCRPHRGSRASNSARRVRRAVGDE